MDNTGSIHVQLVNLITIEPTSTATQPAQPVVTQPQLNMCYWCSEMPAGDFETYCVNARISMQ
jgi:hypothetical protein